MMERPSCKHRLRPCCCWQCQPAWVSSVFPSGGLMTGCKPHRHPEHTAAGCLCPHVQPGKIPKARAPLERSICWSQELDFGSWHPSHQRAAPGASRRGWVCRPNATCCSVLSCCGKTRNSTFFFHRRASLGSRRMGIPHQPQTALLSFIHALALTQEQRAACVTRASNPERACPLCRMCTPVRK